MYEYIYIYIYIYMCVCVCVCVCVCFIQSVRMGTEVDPPSNDRRVFVNFFLLH
jgi:hypothetical protein